MSVKLMSAVWESDLPPTERFVMMSLADHADDMGRQCYPSIARISRRTGYGERAVQGALKRLQERGFLVVEKNAGQGNANLYTITLTPAADAPPQQMHPTPAGNAGYPRSRCTQTINNHHRTVRRYPPYPPSDFGGCRIEKRGDQFLSLSKTKTSARHGNSR